MDVRVRRRRILSCVLASVSLAICVALVTFLHTGRLVRAAQNSPEPSRTSVLGQVRSGSLYALTLGVKDIAALQGNDAVRVTVSDSKGEIESKRLHSADTDFYLTLRARTSGPLTMSLFFANVGSGSSRNQRIAEEDS